MSTAAPRKSSLAGSNSTAPAAPPAPAPATQATPESRRRVQATFYARKATMDRIRGAVKVAGEREGYDSLTDLVLTTVLAEVERMEKKYNGGEPFAGVEPGSLPLGARPRD